MAGTRHPHVNSRKISFRGFITKLPGKYCSAVDTKAAQHCSLTNPNCAIARAAKAGQAEQKMAPSVGQTEQIAAPGVKAGQAQQKEPKRANPQQAQDNTKDGMRPKSMGSETQSQIKPDGKTSLDAKADGKPRPDVKADTKSSEKVGDAKTSITGQSAAAGAANLSTEQRTTIRTVIRQQNVQPATNVNFSISVGSRVSDNVHFYPVPAELVQIQPHWRGYEFILVGDQIIVVNPQTHQIVAVLDA